MKKKPLLISLLCLCIIGAAIYGIFELKANIQNIEMERELIQGKFPEDKKIKLSFYLSRQNPWYRKIRIGISEDAKLESEYIHEKPIPMEVNNFVTLGLDQLYYEQSQDSRRMKEGESEKEAVITKIKDSCMGDKTLSSLYMNMVKDGVTERTFKLKDHLEFLPINLSAFPNIYDGEKFEQKLADKEDIIFRESRLEDYFQFPVPEDMFLQLNFDASREGEYLLSSMGAKLKEPYASDHLDGFVERDLHGNRLFLSFKDSPHYKIPKQYEGIYLLPLHREEDKEHVFEDAFYRLQEIKKIYEFGDGESLENMVLTKNNLLCLLVKFGENYELRFIDRTGKEKENCTLQRAGGEAAPRILCGENGILILYASKKFQWIDQSSLQIILEGSLDIPNFEDYFKPLYVERCKLLFKDKILYLTASKDDQIQVIHLDQKGVLGIVNYSFPLKRKQNTKHPESGFFYGYYVEGLSFFVE